MDRRHAFAYALIAFGVLALLARASGGTGWLWLGVVAAVALTAYVNTRTYALLLLGAVLAGSALGILLTDLFACDGVFLVSLGVGLIAVDRVHPRAQRWATYLGAVLAALGVLAGLIDAGVLGSLWLPALLILAGVVLLWRGRRDAGRFPPPLRPVSTTPPRPGSPPAAEASAPSAPRVPEQPASETPTSDDAQESETPDGRRGTLD